MKKVAIIGSGVSGLTCAWLLRAQYQVTVYEVEVRAGGHTKTIVIPDGPDAGTAVDAGFIVLNDQTYPGLHALLKELGVAWRWSDMSFGYEDHLSGFSFAGRGFLGLFGSVGAFFQVSRWQLYLEITRFSKTALRALQNGMAAKLTMQEFCTHYKFSKQLLDSYVLPMGAAIWSCPAEQMLNFPAEYYLSFFRNHGLLSLKNRPRWQTIVGGSHAYVKVIAAALGDRLKLGTAVTQVKRKPEGIEIQNSANETESFDAVIFACHADQVLPLMVDPSSEELCTFKNWQYEQNSICLHTDISILPSNKNYWASWNFIREERCTEPVLRVTYDMTRLQGLQAQNRYLVSLNCDHLIAEKCKLTQFYFKHPHYNFNSLQSQAKIPELNGQNRTWFCGSYCGYGFHEDAVQSALRVCNDFGCTLKI